MQKFSIIVPCYNVEQYIDECVESIRKQDYQNYEVLLVDDGSSDRTFELCVAWAERDARILAFHKENGGLSDARNYGIEKATGDYLVFVDSDDWIGNASLSSFSEILEGENVDLDVIITRLIEKYPNEQKVNDETMTEKIGVYPTREEAISWIMRGTRNTWPAQKYIVSKSFVKKNNLKFKKGYMHEDVEWTTKLCCYAKKYGVCEYPWYYHRMRRDGSITNTVKAKRILDVLDICYSLIEGPESECLTQVEEYERRIIITRLMSSMYAMLSYYKKVDVNDRNALAEAIRQKRSIFRYTPRFRHKIFFIVMKTIGVKKALDLLALL